MGKVNQRKISMNNATKYLIKFCKDRIKETPDLPSGGYYSKIKEQLLCQQKDIGKNMSDMSQSTFG